MKARKTKKQMEARRMLAAELFEQGIVPSEVSRRLGVTIGAASHWLKAWRESGRDGLRSKPHPGSKPKLARRCWPQLEQMLLEGPTAHGFATELWTLKRVVELIRRHLIVVLDRLAAHRAAARQLTQRHGGAFCFEWLAAYAPELNPVEGVWSQTKYGHLSNLVPGDLEELQERACACLSLIRRQQHSLSGCFAHASLPLSTR